MWTKRDFISLADAIKLASEHEEDKRFETLVDLIIALCEESNPRFDEGRFKERAGL